MLFELLIKYKKKPIKISNCFVAYILLYNI